MDAIETLMSDDQMWFQEKINEMILSGYSIIFSNTNIDSCDRIVWTAILKNIKKGY